jgi:hypothetical protein
MKILAVILFCTSFLATSLFAREKTDVLIMNNGDRLTCEIKGLDGGVLYVSLDYVKGTTPVDWSKVQHMESNQLFIVKTEDGSVYTGTLSTAMTGAARPVHIEVVENPENNVALEQQKVVIIEQTSKLFWQRFNGQINVGMNYSRGNQSRQYTLGAEVQYPRERWSTGASIDSTLSASTGITTTTRNDGSIFVRRMLRQNQWFYTGLSNFLQSSEQSISLQSNLGGGIGHYLKNSNRAKIALIGGLAFQNTQYSQAVSDQGSQNTAAVLTRADVEFFKFDKTNLTISASAFPSISQPGRVFTNTSVSYYVKFFGDFTWNLSFFGNWDNQPPPHFSGSDYGTSSGLGWTFGNSGR